MTHTATRPRLSRTFMLLLLCSVFSGGCSSYRVSPYGLSADNVVRLKTFAQGKNVKIAVAAFSSTEANKGLTCRAAGNIRLPEGVTYSSYLRDSLIAELKLADLYSEASSRTLRANIDFIDFSSSIGNGKWTIRITYSGEGVEKPFTVESVYGFSTNWVADKACQQVAQEFVQAVQRTHAKLIEAPEFSKLMN